MTASPADFSPRLPDRLNIGLSVFASGDANQSIWSSGAVQHVVFLYLLLRSSPHAGHVWLVNGGDGDAIPDGLMVSDLALPLVRLPEVVDQLDLLIEMGAQMSAADADQVHARGGVVLAYRCGNDYVMDVERLSFNQPSGPIFNGNRFDEIWTNGGRVLLDAIHHHDEHIEEHDRKARELLASVDIENQNNVDVHVARMFDLLRRKRQPAG